MGLLCKTQKPALRKRRTVSHKAAEAAEAAGLYRAMKSTIEARPRVASE